IIEYRWIAASHYRIEDSRRSVLSDLLRSLLTLLFSPPYVARCLSSLGQERKRARYDWYSHVLILRTTECCLIRSGRSQTYQAAAVSTLRRRRDKRCRFPGPLEQVVQEPRLVRLLLWL